MMEHSPPPASTGGDFYAIKNFLCLMKIPRYAEIRIAKRISAIISPSMTNCVPKLTPVATMDAAASPADPIPAVVSAMTCDAACDAPAVAAITWIKSMMRTLPKSTKKIMDDTKHDLSQMRPKRKHIPPATVISLSLIHISEPTRP